MAGQEKKDSKGGFVLNLACVLAVAAVTWPPFKVLSVYGVLIAPLIVSWLVLSREESLLRLTLNQQKIFCLVLSTFFFLVYLTKKIQQQKN